MDLRDFRLKQKAEVLSKEEKPHLCKKCKLVNKKCLKGEGRRNKAKIMIIGSNPLRTEVRRSQHYSSEYRNIIAKFLDYGNIDPEEVYFTYLVKCYTTKSNVPKKIINHCQKLLDLQIRKVDPNLIISVGSDVCKFFKGNTTLKKHLLEIEFHRDYKCKVLYSPSFRPLVKNRNKDEIIKKVFAMACREKEDSNLLPQKETYYNIIQDIDELKELKETLDDVSYFAADLETTGFNFKEDSIICCPVSWKPGRASSIVFLDDDNKPFFGKYQEEAWKILNDIMVSDTKKIFHNYKFDKKFFMAAGIYPENMAFDTMLAHHLINENLTHDLSFLSKMYSTGMNGYDVPLLNFVKERKIQSYGEIPRDLLSEYACGDADCTLRLFERFRYILGTDDNINFPKYSHKISVAPGDKKKKLKKKLKKKIKKEYNKDSQLDKLFHNLILPWQEILANMEYEGVHIDKDFLEDLYEEKKKRLDEIQERLNEIAGYEINPRSPKQLRKLLFEELGLPIKEETPSGLPSTKESVLKELQGEHEAVDLLMENRKTGKLFSTYLKGMKKYLLKGDTLHTSYLLHGTKTGRLSSRDPNLQNIPKKSDIQRLFVPREGYKLVEADFSQAELRLLAHVSQDEKLIEAFRSGKDIHRTVASDSMKVPYDEVTTEQRRKAKGISFGIVYGSQAAGLANQLGIEKQEASKLINDFFSEYPAVYNWIKKKHKEVKAKGSIRSLFGRKRRLPNARIKKVLRKIFKLRVGNKKNFKYIELEELRKAQNSPIQASSSDITGFSMIQTYNRIVDEGFDARLIMNIHDAICFEVNENDLDPFVKAMKEEMEDPIPEVFDIELDVPMKVDVEVGDNWCDMKEIEVEIE